LREIVGDVPRMATVNDWDNFKQPTTPQLGHGPGSKVNKSGNGLNGRAVAEVLNSYDLDPIEEMAKAVTGFDPVIARDGTPMVDNEGRPVLKPRLDIDTRMRTLVELAGYTRPKLKSIEVTQKAPELTDEQIDKRLDALLAKIEGRK
jgi:hypothetical protein